jgi:hypothetical protein
VSSHLYVLKPLSAPPGILPSFPTALRVPPGYTLLGEVSKFISSFSRASQAQALQLWYADDSSPPNPIFQKKTAVKFTRAMLYDVEIPSIFARSTSTSCTKTQLKPNLGPTALNSVRVFTVSLGNTRFKSICRQLTGDMHARPRNMGNLRR